MPPHYAALKAELTADPSLREPALSTAVAGNALKHMRSSLSDGSPRLLGSKLGSAFKQAFACRFAVRSSASIRCYFDTGHRHDERACWRTKPGPSLVTTWVLTVGGCKIRIRWGVVKRTDRERILVEPTALLQMVGGN